MNNIQVIGTHNSYHVQPRPQLMALIASIDKNTSLSVEYTHRPLGEQLGRLGVRQVELDVFADPAGGLYAAPLGEFVAPGGSGARADMAAPGLKVLHAQDIDYETTCRTFKVCLKNVLDWSNANPGHVPLMILIEAKDEPLVLPPGVQLPRPPITPVKFNADLLSSIDTEILSVIPRTKILTPDDVRGSRATLEEAILTDGWPSLEAVRGKVFFTLDNTDQKRADYIAGHPSLSGRVLFTSSDPSTPEAAFVKINDPVADYWRIQQLVSRGYIVRTRADDNTIEARTADPRRRVSALGSGAQFVSTDYPEADPFGNRYVVVLPGGGTARCNPVAAPANCDSTVLEKLATSGARPPVAPGPPNTGLGTGEAGAVAPWRLAAMFAGLTAAVSAITAFGLVRRRR